MKKKWLLEYHNAMAKTPSNPTQERALNSLGIMMIATNGYLELWKNTALSIERECGNSFLEIRIRLFTDELEEAEVWANENLKKIKLVVVQIPSYGWPEATLFRYEIFLNNFQSFTEDLLMYLDSDMEVLKDFTAEISPKSWAGDIALVAHPGYYDLEMQVKSKGRYLPSNILRKVKYSKFFRGGYGDWEDRKTSTAFVPKRHRNTYVHGAIWFGWRGAIQLLIETLRKNVLQDSESNIIAKWHDESHLNWFYNNFQTTLLTPKFSGFRSYSFVMQLEPCIITVQKKPGQGRNATKKPVNG